MKQVQIKVTKENLLQWIENYRWIVENIEEARQPVSKVDNNSYIGVLKQLSMVLRQYYQRQVVVRVIQSLLKYNVVCI